MGMHHRQSEIQCLILNKLTRRLWVYKKRFLHHVNDVLEILNTKPQPPKSAKKQKKHKDMSMKIN